MSVNPGFGGQSFIPSTLDKLKFVRKIIHQYEENGGNKIRLEVDGGVNVNNIAQIAQAGADTFVAGSAIYSKPNYKAVIDSMKQALASP
jgi:ribulose-phosphate 3-epimerase